MTLFIFELWAFILNPKIENYSLPISANKKRADIYHAILFYFLAAGILFIPISGLNKIIDYFFSIDIFKIRDSNIKSGLTGIKALVVVALIAPVIEETVFRLWLNLNKTNAIVSLTLIRWILIKKQNNVNIYTGQLNNVFFFNLILALVFGILIFALLNSPFFKTLLRKNFKFLYWISCIGFGLIHITNFAPVQLNVVWAYPLFILPQLLLGFILGFIREKNGFYWALSIHCLVNLPGAIQLFFKH